jgi:histidinol-phosphate aminotransferase
VNRPQPRDDLRALEGYHSPQLEVDVRLNTNESPLAPPPAFVDAWVEAVRTVPLHRYPDRSASRLRQELGASLGHPADRVFCANGSNEVLQTLMLTYAGPGRRVLVVEPTYALHSHIARITGTQVVTMERRPDFSVDPDALADAIRAHEPAIVFLCSPNNPTGTVDAPAVLEAALGAASGLVVVDEAYGEFADRSALAEVDDDRPLVVVRTYSKVWSMAALRLGYCVAPAWVVAELDKVVLPYHLAAATQAAGTVALAYREEMAARVRELVGERERLFGALAGIDGIDPVPSGANFLLFRVGAPGDVDAARAVWDRLVAHKVLVRDFSGWPGVEGCLRVTVGTRAENDAFLAALQAAVRESGTR